jgi:hypothetical protein
LADTFDRTYAARPGRTPTTNTATTRTQETWLLRTNPRGELSRLPTDFQFPKGGMYDCWVQWNVGHIERSIPVLRSLTPREFQFIDAIAKTDAEKRSLRGPCQNKETRRPSRKTYSNMKFLCNYIQEKASKAGVDTTDRGLENVRRMFDAASAELLLLGAGDRERRIDQFKWRTMVFRIRKRLKAQQQSAAT